MQVRAVRAVYRLEGYAIVGIRAQLYPWQCKHTMAMGPYMSWALYSSSAKNSCVLHLVPGD